MLFIAVVIGWGADLTGRTILLETDSETKGQVQPKSQCFFRHLNGGTGLAFVLVAAEKETISAYNQLKDRASEEIPTLRALSA